jgi:hypothetical protein
MKVDRHLLNTIQSLLPVQIFICYCFCISGLFVNFLQVLTWIFIRPFHKQLYRLLNYHLATLIWSRKFEYLFLRTYKILILCRIDFSLFLVGGFECVDIC